MLKGGDNFMQTNREYLAKLDNSKQVIKLGLKYGISSFWEFGWWCWK